jgi:hypothetical protein
MSVYSLQLPFTFFDPALLRLDKLFSDGIIVGGGILPRIETHLLGKSAKKRELSLEV